MITIAASFGLLLIIFMSALYHYLSRPLAKIPVSIRPAHLLIKLCFITFAAIHLHRYFVRVIEFDN
jgi:hypothetical protein